MKKILLLCLVLIVFIAACGVSEPEDVEGRVYCEEPRPEICAAVFDPVCGDNGQTYSNACNACSDADVRYSDAGECE